MQDLIVGRLQDIALGAAQTHGSIVVLPLIGGQGSPLEYLTLTEALQAGLLTVTELGSGARVPELEVVNHGDRLILLLEGEELVGAKQNRVLNTSVLVPPHRSVRIPVSCTEAGRWAFTSREFADGGKIMARELRTHLSCSVTSSLEEEESYASDQIGVWNCIEDLQMVASVKSATRAMSDVYERYRAPLDEALGSFPPVPGQCGLLVLEDGRVVGLELLSRASAYAPLHSRLVASHLLEHVVGRPQPTLFDVPLSVEAAWAFLEQVGGCERKVFASVGCGDDCRLRGEDLAGSALAYDGTVVYLTAFRTERRPRA
jgi:hypothetical protein